MWPLKFLRLIELFHPISLCATLLSVVAGRRCLFKVPVHPRNDKQLGDVANASEKSIAEVPVSGN